MHGVRVCCNKEREPPWLVCDSSSNRRCANMPSSLSSPAFVILPRRQGSFTCQFTALTLTVPLEAYDMEVALGLWEKSEVTFGYTAQSLGENKALQKFFRLDLNKKTTKHSDPPMRKTALMSGIRPKTAPD